MSRDNFALNTDITTLISPKLEWRQREVSYLKAFPGQATTILAVIDGPTPELAEDAAQKLTQKLNQLPNNIRSAQEMMGGPFFRRNGMLFLDEVDLKEALSQLTRSSSFLEPLAADPSLRGVMDAFALPLRGVRLRRVSLDSLAPQFNALAAPIETTLAGRPAYFSWRELLSGQPPSGRETRQFVEIDPVLDFNALEPGAHATDAIHRAAYGLKLKEQGVTVRLTGSIPNRRRRVRDLERGGGAERRADGVRGPHHPLARLALGTHHPGRFREPFRWAVRHRRGRPRHGRRRSTQSPSPSSCSSSGSASISACNSA